MSWAHHPDHHHVGRHHHKPLAERYQTLIAGTIAIALIFALVFGVALLVPMSPMPADDVLAKMRLEKRASP